MFLFIRFLFSCQFFCLLDIFIHSLLVSGSSFIFFKLFTVCSWHFLCILSSFYLSTACFLQFPFFLFIRCLFQTVSLQELSAHPRDTCPTFNYTILRNFLAAGTSVTMYKLQCCLHLKQGTVYKLSVIRYAHEKLPYEIISYCGIRTTIKHVLIFSHREILIYSQLYLNCKFLSPSE